MTWKCITKGIVHSNNLDIVGEVESNLRDHGNWTDFLDMVTKDKRC